MIRGTVVRLASGGPKMTIRERLYNEDDSFAGLRCVWFHQDLELKEANFSPEELIEVSG